MEFNHAGVGHMKVVIIFVDFYSVIFNIIINILYRQVQFKRPNRISCLQAFRVDARAIIFMIILTHTQMGGDSHVYLNKHDI